jgi:hypothetical protein
MSINNNKTNFDFNTLALIVSWVLFVTVITYLVLN